MRFADLNCIDCRRFYRVKLRPDDTVTAQTFVCGDCQRFSIMMIWRAWGGLA